MIKKMKFDTLLLMTYDYPPESLWGVAKHVNILYTKLKNEFNINVSTRFNEHNKFQLSSDKITDENLIKSDFSPLESYVDFEYLLSWNYLLGKKIISSYEKHKKRPNIIHNHTWMTFPAALKIKKHFDCKLISSLHFLEKQYGGLKKLPTEIDFKDILRIEDMIIQDSDALIVFGKNHRNFIRDNYNVNLDKTYVIPHGLDLNTFKEYRSSPVEKTEKININFVGRLVPEKGVRELVSVVNDLTRKYPNIRLNLIGDGYLRKSIKETESINLYGLLNQDKVFEMNKNAQIFCFPSYTETFGYAVLEAMAIGLPIISSKGKNVEKLLKKNEALFVDVDSSKDLSINCVQLKQHLENLINSFENRKIYSEKSVLASERYSQDKMLSKIRMLYKVLGDS